MKVDVVLVCLRGAGTELELILDRPGALPRRRPEQDDSPDSVARTLADGIVGTDQHVARHKFRTKDDDSNSVVTLVYRQLLPAPHQVRQPSEADLLSSGSELVRVLNAGELEGGTLDETDQRIALGTVADLRSDLRQVMSARENRQGLVHLLQLLPEIFDHKELMATYVALTGEKPASALMLARMMLDRYTIGSGEKAREVQGRNLIREYEEEPRQILSEKWEKNKELYRRGGPKAKRLYKQVLF